MLIIFLIKALTNIRPKKFYSCVSGARINPGETIDRSLFDASFRFPGAKEDEHINLKAIKENDIILPVPFKFFFTNLKMVALVSLLISLKNFGIMAEALEYLAVFKLQNIWDLKELFY